MFSHPLARAAVLAGSDVAERAAAHRALAGVLDGDRRAWHLAALADGPDEQVAAELDAAAQRAGRRGSRAAASAAYERAAALSASPAAKGRRLALAAEAATDAGQLPRAADLAGQAGQLVTDPAAVAAMARVRAQLEFEAGRPADSVGILLEWAALLGPADPGRRGGGAGRGRSYAVAGRRPGAPGARAAGGGYDACGSEARGVPAGGAAVAGRRYRRAGHRSGHTGPWLASVLRGVLPAIL